MQSYLFIIASLTGIPTVLGLTCETPWLLYNEQCFGYFEEQVVHSVAKERCQLEAARLIPYSVATDFVRMHNGKNNHSSYWCDRRRDNIQVSVAALKVRYPATMDSEAITASSTNSNNKMQCCYIQDKGVHEGTCDQRKGFICEKVFVSTSATCPQDTLKIGTSCWWQHQELLDRHNAERACNRKLGGRLAILDEKEKVKYGYAAVNEMRESFWVGAREHEEKIKWDNGKILDLKVNNSFIGFKNYSGIYLRFGLDNATISGAAWILGGPNNLAYALCEGLHLKHLRHPKRPARSPTSPCPETGIENDGMCYWESSDRKSWRDARKHCERRAGDLVSFKDEKEHKIFLSNNENSTANQEKMWIGLRRYRYDGRNVFRWSDGSNSTYRNWALGQPVEDDDTKLCVARGEQNLTWEVTDCTTELLFMCKAISGICGGNLRSDSGTFHSPNYPKSYKELEDCTWEITVSDGFTVYLQFTDFDLEDSKDCEKDFVKVIDGHGPNSPILGKYCAERNPWSISSSSNKMSVQFVTDDVANQHGFNATFTKGICGGSIYSDNGTFQSPNYPNPYPQFLNCVWNITVPEDYQVILQFQTFKLVDSEHCKFDFVHIIDGHESDSAVLGKYCGSGNPGLFHSSTNKMAVIFATEKGIDEPGGFSAIFTQGKECPEPKQSGDNVKWWKFQDNCYMIPTSDGFQLTWDQADKFCERYNASVASVHSVKELDYLHLLHPKYMNSWLGLRTKDLNSTHEWSDGTPLILDSLKLDKDQKHDNSSNEDVCISFDISTGLLKRNNCNSLLSVICKFQLNSKNETSAQTPPIPSLDMCPLGWKTFGNKCYSFSGSLYDSQKKPWAAANEECKKYYGSTLVSLRSREEQDFVLLDVFGGYGEIWIGMNYTQQWTDNSISNFTNWAEGEPQMNGDEERCVSIKYSNSSSSQWYTMNCTQFLPYVCQTRRGTNFSSPYDHSLVTSTSSASHPDAVTVPGTSSASHQDSSTKSITVNSDRRHTPLYVSVGIPVGVACLVILILVASILYTPKHYARLEEPAVKFINRRTLVEIIKNTESVEIRKEIPLNEYHRLQNL